MLFRSVAGLSAISARWPTAVVLGATATSLFLLGGVMITGLQAGIVFLIWIGLIGAIQMLRPRERLPSHSRCDAIDVFAIACLAVLVAFWCRHSAAALPELKASGILPVWTDYYIHGTIIAQFGDALAVHRGSLDLADQPWVFYHYSSYIIAAALAGVVQFPGLGLSTAIQLPVGLLLAAIGSYALATTLGDRRAGVTAIAAFMLLPDPSTYGFANGYFGFFWMMFTGPGAGYALGSAAVALVCAVEWFRTRNWRPLALALAIAGAMFEEIGRAHV